MGRKGAEIRARTVKRTGTERRSGDTKNRRHETELGERAGRKKSIEKEREMRDKRRLTAGVF
jgi:hypothetical protein